MEFHIFEYFFKLLEVKVLRQTNVCLCPCLAVYPSVCLSVWKLKKIEQKRLLENLLERSTSLWRRYALSGKKVLLVRVFLAIALQWDSYQGTFETAQPPHFHLTSSIFWFILNNKTSTIPSQGNLNQATFCSFENKHNFNFVICDKKCLSVCPDVCPCEKNVTVWMEPEKVHLFFQFWDTSTFVSNHHQDL